MQKDHFTTGEYRLIQHSISFLKVNILALLYPLPLVVLFVVAYFFIRSAIANELFSKSPWLENSLYQLIMYLGIVMIALVLHECTHALVFLRHSKNGRKSIKFGIKSLTPYCHCEEVISLNAYRHACLAPLYSICLPLAIISIVTGNSIFFLIAITMIFGSGGDLWVFFVTRKYNGRQTYVWDMEDKVGCEIYVPTNISPV
ncbi:MAG: DUF3267 domain-containing protein [Clostridiaceae bacterium]|nr:DUF3267 domain-containing protein [Clostridiaceae bacterium]